MNKNENHTYKVIELVGSSPNGVTEAINEAVTRASKTIKGLDWFEVSADPRQHPGQQHRLVPGVAEGRLPRDVAGRAQGVTTPRPCETERRLRSASVAASQRHDPVTSRVAVSDGRSR